MKNESNFYLFGQTGFLDNMNGDHTVHALACLIITAEMPLFLSSPMFEVAGENGADFAHGFGLFFLPIADNVESICRSIQTIGYVDIQSEFVDIESVIGGQSRFGIPEIKNIKIEVDIPFFTITCVVDGIIITFTQTDIAIKVRMQREQTSVDGPCAARVN